MKAPAMLRLGLCCIFRESPIRFRQTTAKALSGLDRKSQLAKLSELCLHNANALEAALHEIHRLGFGAFRVNSQFFPLCTHPSVGYQLQDLPDAQSIADLLDQVGRFRATHGLRLSFHPDQFILLSTLKPEVLQASIAELEYQGLVAERIGADVINVHGGGAYGDKQAALDRFAEIFPQLSLRVRQRLTLENDDRTYTVRDLLPLCRRIGVPLVYDVHHHRCNPDDLSIAQATELTMEIWNQAGREPYFHLSSPKNGWETNPGPHADFIDPADFPAAWRTLSVTIDIEAKAKELAVLKLQKDLALPAWSVEVPALP